MVQGALTPHKLGALGRPPPKVWNIIDFLNKILNALQNCEFLFYKYNFQSTENR